MSRVDLGHTGAWDQRAGPARAHWSMGRRVRRVGCRPGYIATGVGEGDREVLSQVAFRGEDLAAMELGTVYTNDTDPDVRELAGRSAETSPPMYAAGDELRAGLRGRAWETAS